MSHKSVLQECHLDICSFSNVFAFGFVGSILFFIVFSFFSDSDSFGFLTSNKNELAVHAFETGCWLVPVLVFVSWLCARR